MKRLVRNLIEGVLRKSGTETGKRWIREISYWRDGRSPAVPFSSLSDDEKAEVFDRNIDPPDDYCPVCDGSRRFELLSDNVKAIGKVRSRKRLWNCTACRYAFTCEDRGERADYFADSPYDDDQSGKRNQRELDLVEIARQLLRREKDIRILIYGAGMSTAKDTLVDKGYGNVWAADVSDGLPYGERMINILEQPSYFANHSIQFDVIIAVEVWEHIGRPHVNAAFRWLSETLSDDGLILATTSLWFPTPSDPVFRASKEWGHGQLGWWHYPHFVDHTSFYSTDNLAALCERNGCEVEFAYFAAPRVHLQDPFKRVIAVRKQSNEALRDRMAREFRYRYLDVFYA